MNSIKFLPIIICLIALANGAPTTDSPAGQESATTVATTPLTNAADSSSTQAPPQQAEASSTTTTTPTQPQADTSSSLARQAEEVSPLSHEQLNKTSSFTCYGRSIGYYADIERDCKVYHFCLLGDYDGDAVYQRITYLCLKDTVFDQQLLDCVEEGKLSISCKDSEVHYVTSNASLRQAIVGHKLHGNETNASASSSTTTSTTTAATPST